MKQNCWEFKKCGREPNGSAVAESGICKATTHALSDRVNSGENGGRVCWAISETYCPEKVEGSFAVDLLSCSKCDFFKKLQSEEADQFILLPYKKVNLSNI